MRGRIGFYICLALICAAFCLGLPTTSGSAGGVTVDADAGDSDWEAVDTGGFFSADGRVNINLAPPELLQALPGIGSTLARRIVEGRPYGAPEELLEVSGIGGETLLELLPLICVE